MLFSGWARMWVNVGVFDCHSDTVPVTQHFQDNRLDKELVLPWDLLATLDNPCSMLSLHIQMI
jgi:hypothetical protein